MNVTNTSTAVQLRAYRRGTVHAVAGGEAMRIAAISSQITFTMFTKFTRAGGCGFTFHAVEADNRDSLSIVKRPALGVMFLQGTSSRQIFGGLRIGAGCLPSSGGSGSSNAPVGLRAEESAPTRFNFSMNRVATPAKAAMARLASLSNLSERAHHA